MVHVTYAAFKTGANQWLGFILVMSQLQGELFISFGNYRNGLINKLYDEPIFFSKKTVNGFDTETFHLIPPV